MSFKFGDIIIVNNRRAVVVNVKEFQLSVNPEYYYTICYEGDNKISMITDGAEPRLENSTHLEHSCHINHSN